ncbi:hypothetical protein AXF42_Ash013306 [Apostasia shenzhenica]|uniref:Uncharacterized protein n=1 Tax=Apostasia shenzhenica TaxID=1088818 RepID=A0A2I0BBK8_9ASPA|nr:hypothetical protein AXF42_Ash013306 [Apostasia shenzhenica]
MTDEVKAHQGAFPLAQKACSAISLICAIHLIGEPLTANSSGMFGRGDQSENHVHEGSVKPRGGFASPVVAARHRRDG